MQQGAVKAVVLDKGYGFISVPSEPKDTFFHFTGLSGGLTFDEQLTGRRVTFDVVSTSKGQRAENIRPVE